MRGKAGEVPQLETCVGQFQQFLYQLPYFSAPFLTCVWNPRCLSMVTPKYLQRSDFFTKVEPTVTVSESLRRLSFLREKVMNSVLLQFKFSLFRQKYSSNFYILFCNISRAISDFLSLQKTKQSSAYCNI